MGDHDNTQHQTFKERQVTPDCRLQLHIVCTFGYSTGWKLLGEIDIRDVQSIPYPLAVRYASSTLVRIARCSYTVQPGDSETRRSVVRCTYHPNKPSARAKHVP